MSRDVLARLESEVRDLRVSLADVRDVRRAPESPGSRIVLVLAELARTQATLGDVDAARASIDDVHALLDDESVRDDVVVADARFSVGLALAALADPTCRIVLEDAGTLYEELGDIEGMARVDAALREAEAMIEESPRSFQMRVKSR